MAQQDYYEILGVARQADAKAIKEAYRKLAFQYHPDRNEAKADSADRMKQINEAYAVLSDAQKRRAYDGMRSRFGDQAYGQFRNAYSEQDIFSGSDVQQIFEEMARSFGLRGADDLFKGGFGPGGRHSNPFQQAGRGRVFVFGNQAGRAGGGSGVMRLAGALLRKALGLALPQMGADLHDTIVVPPQLATSGGPFAYHHRKRAKKLVVHIPSRTRNGQKIRLTRMGSPGKNGGEPGNLYLKIKIRKSWIEKAKELIVSHFGR